jgi:hypothetical protein
MFEDWNLSHPIPIGVDLKVSEETRQERVEICNNCDKLTVLKTCKECGCIMPFKTWLKISTCPLKKWTK